MSENRGYRFELSLFIECPKCNYEFDFVDVDDWAEDYGQEVCTAKNDIITYCPDCKSEFKFDVLAGL